ncbi:mitotic checkpoint serine/threonine-protein kinase BUB1 beta isoform X2 [Hyperolius riggenbachi]
MAEAGDEWELCKENVQPVRQGRAMSTLQEVLSQQESSHHHAIQQQRQAFELELRFYNGDDPLDVWDRYIKWAVQAFPQGGKESNLSPLLERAVRIFHEDKRYYDDPRYLSICLKFGTFCTEPVDLYSYLHGQGIGIQHAQLYITWAEEYEARGNYKKADSIFQQGIQCNSEPREKLEASHKQFQARVSRQVLQSLSDEGDAESPEPSEHQRNSLADLKARGKNIARAPVSRVGDATKPRGQSLSTSMAPPQQIPSRPRFAVFDENASIPASGGQPAAGQPWAALPPSRAKENEQKAGPWNSGKSSRNQSSSHDPALSLPSFTPYVDEMAEQQIVTPCKINPSITSVLSARKPSKEEDPLQRLQSSSQEKKEVAMYCKDKIFAGVEEFTFEEIRAEIYMMKVRKKREEDLLASAQRRQEMEKQIEEMEKKLKGSPVNSQEHMIVQPAESETSGLPETAESELRQDAMPSRSAPLDEDNIKPGWCSFSAVPLPSTEVFTEDQNVPCSNASLCAVLSSSVPFTIFDETCEAQTSITTQNLKKMPPPARRPLTAVPKALLREDAPLTDTLDIIEPLNEDPIVSGSDKNKTLFADPEDTCDFVSAAHLASTPFHKPRDENSGESDSLGLARIPLREKTPVYEESFQQAVCLKKLSPILEASREDTPSSVSSSTSAGCSSLFSSKTMLAHEKLDLASQVSGVYEQVLECSVSVGRTELRKNLLAPLSELLTSEQLHQEAVHMPLLRKLERVQLGGTLYHLKSETILGESSSIYTGIPTGQEMENMKGIVIKVDSEPVPWDFYVTQQLRERLGEDFQSDFVAQNDCYLFQDGCINLYKNINHFTVKDIAEDPELVEKVVILIAYNLLSIVEKLHSVEIIHGDLRPDTLVLDDRCFDILSCTEMNGCIKPIDFSHSMDLHLCPTVTSRAFPIADTEYGQLLLGSQTYPYQVDLLGIANLVHLMIFRSNLQVHQEDSVWKISREIPSLWDGSLWNMFFSKILNTESSATVLKELKNAIAHLFDSDFQDELCSYFIQMENPL